MSLRAYEKATLTKPSALCNHVGKKVADYIRLSNTKEFLQELSSDMGIPVSELIQVIKCGIPELQGTWVHPQVAMNLGQWASPKFAVLVSKWVLEWMRGEGATNYKFPYHIRRYLINRSKIPPTHFSILDQITIKLLGALETKRRSQSQATLITPFPLKGDKPP